MKSGIAFFLAGSLFSGVLFQFDLGLPSFHAYQLKSQEAKLNKAKSEIRNKRSRLSKKAVEKAGKKAAGSLLPLIGSVVTLGLAAEDYCDELEQIIELQNILESAKEKYDFEACLIEAKSFFTSSLN